AAYFEVVGKFWWVEEAHPVRVQVAQTIGHHTFARRFAFSSQAQGQRIIGTGDQQSVVWQKSDEAAESRQHVVQRGENIRVIIFDVRDKGDLRRQAEEHIAIFVRLDYKDIAFARVRVRAGIVHDAAHDVGWIFLSLAQQVDDQGCGGRLAMGPGHGDL